MPAGFHDRILKVDLTSRTWEIDSPGEQFFRRYLGGRALVAYYMAKEMDLSADALSPGNLLIFAPGVATGSTISGPGRNSVGGKSPLTGAMASAEVGGFWGAELKRAGFDAIVVKGRASSPVYLWIKDGQVEIRSAEHLWGLDVGPAEDRIREELGDKGIRTALIGPAGENLVRYACVVNDKSHFAGRGGMGAVMGSKNLKAIACRGPMGKSGLMEINNPSGVAEINKWLAQQGLPMVDALGRLGTAGNLMGYGYLGNLPTNNFQAGSHELQEQLSGERMAETILKKRETCYACSVRCKRAVEIHEPYNVSAEYGGPEYETLSGLGSNCGVFDLNAVAKASERCAALGMDTISAGMAISWAMECFNKGKLTAADTGGEEIKFGDADMVMKLVEMIAVRQGVGDLLAEGSLRAARKIGRGTEDYVVHVKGQELPMHDPRTKHALGVGFAVSPTGADHMHNLHDSAYTNDKSRWLRDAQMYNAEFAPVEIHGFAPEKLKLWNHHTNYRHALDSMVMCHFLPYNPQQMVGMINAITGWEMDIYELHRVGQRANTLCRIVNAGLGFGRDDDTLPKRMFEQARDSRTGVPIDPEALQVAISEVYKLNGWDPETGVPTRARLEELELEWAV